MPRHQQLQHSAHGQELRHTDCGDRYNDPTYDCDEWGKKIWKNKKTEWRMIKWGIFTKVTLSEFVFVCVCTCGRWMGYVCGCVCECVWVNVGLLVYSLPGSKYVCSGYGLSHFGWLHSIDVLVKPSKNSSWILYVSGMHCILLSYIVSCIFLWYIFLCVL